MKILIIEDHPYKLSQLQEFLNTNFPDTEISVKNSYNSGLKELVFNYNKYELLLLDISMPNYDISTSESGGDFMPLAGRLILKEMYLREIPTKAIVVTMYENFVDGTPLFDLDLGLKREFQDNYMGYVYFTASNNAWMNQLKILINKIVE